MTQWGLDTLFNPGKRHMDDEKRRLQSTREEIGDSSGGRRIDLESGRVAISVNRTPAADVDEAAEDLAPALEAEDVPAVALANDEAEIEPELVDDVIEPEVEVTTVEDPAVETPAVVEVSIDVDEHDDTDDDVPIDAPEPEPVVAATPRRKTLSANAWANRG